MKDHWRVAALLAGGLVTRFMFIWWPREVVFDEVHFGKFLSGYLTGEYFFDIHPPLGKLLLAAAAWIGGFRAGFSFSDIGLGYGGSSYIALRILPNLAGAFIPIAAYWLFRGFKMSGRAAFFGAFLLMLDNALLVQSHFILVDAFLIVFGVAGLAAFLESRNRAYDLRWLSLAGALLGLSISVKWTGLGFLGGAFLVLLSDSVRVPKLLPFWKSHWKHALVVALMPVAVYLAVFAVHFQLLTKPGPGDAFMQQNFQEKSFLAKFQELNTVMYTANAGLTATHPYASKAASWPLMTRPVYYWVKSMGGETARIYLLGNPIVWWSTTFFGIFALLSWRRGSETRFFLVALWALQYVPFFFIGRVLFLYHYLAPLVCAIGFMAAWLDEREEGERKRFIYAIGALALAAFVFFAPLSYGRPLNDAGYKMRTWLGSWI